MLSVWSQLTIRRNKCFLGAKMFWAQFVSVLFKSPFPSLEDKQLKASSWKQKSKNTSLSFQSHLFLGLLHHPSRICSSSAKDSPPWSFILTSFFSKSLCETVHRSRHVTLHDWHDTGAGTIGNLKYIVAFSWVDKIPHEASDRS